MDLIFCFMELHGMKLLPIFNVQEGNLVDM